MRQSKLTELKTKKSKAGAEWTKKHGLEKNW